MKIREILENYKSKKKPFYSFEFFPPKTEPGLYNLYARLDRMAQLEPAFVDVTWGAGGSTSEKSLEISENAQKYFGLDVMMHLTCTNMSIDSLKYALDTAAEKNIQNILALRGDPPAGQKEWQKCEGGFAYASDLIHFIKKNYGQKFGIAVAGYPEGHLECETKDECIERLKMKVDAGADAIVTQLFYDIEEFYDFLERCEKAKISIPVIPGVLPIQTYSRFTKFTELCQLKVPPKIASELAAIKGDDSAVAEYGVELATDMCKRMLDAGSPGIHLYTLNLETAVTKILDNLGLLEDCRNRRSLPWRKSTMPNRRKEDVRPIFWSNRPKSYLVRTRGWDDYPNGRWGDSRSPSFGELNDYYLFRRGVSVDSLKKSRLEMWGEPQTTADIADVFVSFCKGKINRLPWCEFPVQAETSRIAPQLQRLNQFGFFTINSQPQVNGCPSEDPDVGWGGPGGVVYQKAYVEFFTSKENFAKFQKECERHQSITYQAFNVQGEYFANIDDANVNAVTWGVFPGKEIIQPTVVDGESFRIWKDEAFQIWLDEWRTLYEKDSAPYQLINEIHQNYVLVNVVENDFQGGDIFRIFEPLLRNAQPQRALQKGRAESVSP